MTSKHQRFAAIQFLQIARETKDICAEYGVPVLINDRIDIALAIDADGVHVGQTDMPASMAKRFLPPGKIIGVSCNNVDHVKKAVEDGADYVGIGAVWATNTKKLTSPVLGAEGVRDLLAALDGTSVKAVAIGAIPYDSLVLYRPDARLQVESIVTTYWIPCKSLCQLRATG